MAVSGVSGGVCDWERERASERVKVVKNGGTEYLRLVGTQSGIGYVGVSIKKA